MSHRQAKRLRKVLKYSMNKDMPSFRSAYQQYKRILKRNNRKLVNPVERTLAL